MHEASVYNSHAEFKTSDYLDVTNNSSSTRSTVEGASSFSSWFGTSRTDQQHQQRIYTRHQYYANGIEKLEEITAVMIVLHGYGEHCTCKTIQKIAGIMNQENIVVYSFDIRLFNKCTRVVTVSSTTCSHEKDINEANNQESIQNIEEIRMNIDFEQALEDIASAIEDVSVCFPAFQFPNLKILLFGYSFGATLGMQFLTSSKFEKIPDKRLNGLILVSPFIYNCNGLEENDSQHHSKTPEVPSESSSWSLYFLKKASYWLPNYQVLHFDKDTIKKKFSEDLELLEMLENDPVIRENSSMSTTSHTTYLLPPFTANFAQRTLEALKEIENAFSEKGPIHTEQSVSAVRRSHNLRVLFMHGRNDTLSPAANSSVKWNQELNRHHEFSTISQLILYENRKHYFLLDRDSENVFGDILQFIKQQCLHDRSSTSN
ncbi:hypothetical protein C9374_014347 [Naegleria lovaniensis]|uniref:Serine aminopeptidase S33 domain-containing protein n=1 Tax=Naegleria lovaniensis TaxID=51637 RepID=A0AA88KU30_NAELO|nr:uncharacterized protein C9374_014347 [Naegleria lovaniensis]KAG2388947.1 hypothetical protein C9374_014347 [Naegleria lovaniensis]